MFSHFSKYMPIQKEEPGEDSNTIDDELYMQKKNSRSRIRVALNHLYVTTLHILLLLAAIRLFYDHQQKKHLETRLLPSELPFAQEAVKYEEITFEPSGFWKDPSQRTPFEGPMSPETDSEWRRLTAVGMLSVTEEEYKALNIKTMPVPGQSDKYLVTIEMFHQLHCLHYIRRRLYGGVILDITEHAKQVHLGTVYQSYLENKKLTEIDHCIDYLRQVLMCHGDLTPITLSWDQDLEWVSPNFAIQHTCRNFESIWQFAESRNDTGIIIE